MKAPVIIDIHGGPEGQSRPTFNAFHQHTVAELGAAVIVTNVRGSTGYGKTLPEPRQRREARGLGQGHRRPAGLDQDAAGPGSVAGGGLWPVVRRLHVAGRDDLAIPTVWPAGSSAMGSATSFRSCRTPRPHRRDLRRAEYGDERDPKMLKAFETISPMNNVDKISKPMLVMQGWNDPRVPKSESDQVVAKLREKGIETWYVQFKDEGHGFLKKANNDRRREVETQFLRKVLGVSPTQ
ncbi:alpha/beta hydrolase family protein [Caulobacter segnis]